MDNRETEEKITLSEERQKPDAFALALKEPGVVSVVAFLIIILTGNIVLENMIVVPAGAVLVLLWAWRSKTPWSQLGFVRPASWAATIFIAIIFGVALKLLMKTVVMPLLGAPTVNQTFQFLAGNPSLIPTAIWAMFMAGFGEELVFRGFLFERLSKIFGTSHSAKIFIVVLTSVGFGVSHYNLQGLAGVEQATLFGLLFGWIYIRTNQILTLMIAHTTFDLTAYAIIYWEWEEELANLIF